MGRRGVGRNDGTISKSVDQYCVVAGTGRGFENTFRAGRYLGTTPHGRGLRDGMPHASSEFCCRSLNEWRSLI